MTETPLFTTTIGSHLWGHATAASDIDHLEVYAADPREILAGIGPTRGKAQRMVRTADGLYDIQSVEVEHLVRLLIGANPNAIIWVMSPLVVAENERYAADLARLREIVPATMSQAIYSPVAGWANGYVKDAARSCDAALRAKCFLGCRRVIDFGIRYLGGEIAFGPTGMDGDLDECFQALAAAKERSTLPERADEAPYRAWLYGLRCRLLEDLREEPV